MAKAKCDIVFERDPRGWLAVRFKGRRIVGVARFGKKRKVTQKMRREAREQLCP